MALSTTTAQRDLLHIEDVSASHSMDSAFYVIRKTQATNIFISLTEKNETSNKKEETSWYGAMFCTRLCLCIISILLQYCFCIVSILIID